MNLKSATTPPVLLIVMLTALPESRNSLPVIKLMVEAESYKTVADSECPSTPIFIINSNGSVCKSVLLTNK